ncbi:4Fe-4S binding protein, partial [bacterium]|nr:4Fe-4S binding protein [bacterium]
MSVWIKHEDCSGCGACLKVCPYSAVEIIDGKAVMNERCTECGACLTSCKEKAILTDVTEKTIPDFSNRKGVWVFAEQKEGRVANVTFELLGQGRELANKLAEPLCAMLLGDQVGKAARDLIYYGADKVYLAESGQLDVFVEDTFTEVITGLIKEHKPNIVLFGATALGRSLAPRVASRLETGLTAD